MGLFVHEFFSSGAYPGDLGQSSLAREGLAMLGAVLEDFAGCIARRPAMTLDRRLTADARKAGLSDWAEIHWAESPQHESILFEKFAAETEATFVIAPESGGCLLGRRSRVERAGGRFLGHSADAIRLCADKLAFCEHLTRHELPTIPTQLFDTSAKKAMLPFPVVVKPRDGAGSEHTFLIRDEDHFGTLRAILSAMFERSGREAIIQPYVAGRALSVAAIADSHANSVEVFPVGEQRLSDDGRFHYHGGEISAVQRAATGVEALIASVCRSIAGLAGYVGFDLILPVHSKHVLIVEANPRLTTSYLGYRALANENLAARILQPGRAARSIAWAPGTVEFNADGPVRVCTH
jgi:predicted ATP-grasp superfamily ATP-dependent carboligase